MSFQNLFQVFLGNLSSLQKDFTEQVALRSMGGQHMDDQTIQEKDLNDLSSALNVKNPCFELLADQLNNFSELEIPERTL